METIIFTNLCQQLEWKHYQEVFSEFGNIAKLYIDPSKSFGKVQFSSAEDAHAAKKELDGKPPLNLVITFAVSDNTRPFNTALNMHRGRYNRYNNDELDVNPSNVEYVDVYGRILETFEGCDGEVYVPLTELRISGFDIFPRTARLPKFGDAIPFDEKLLHHHELYLKMKSKEFMIATAQEYPQEALNKIIDKIQKEYGNQANSQNKHYRGGRSRERRSYDGQERKGPANQTNHNSSYNTNWNNHNTSRHDASTSGDNSRQRRSYNNDGKSHGGPASGRNRSYNDNRNENNMPKIERTINFSKPPQREPLNKDIPQKVKVVHLESESVAWVQLSSNVNLIRDFMIQTMEESRNASVTTPIVDKIYSALYSDVWFRALIISPYPLTVQFIDFGNECSEDIKEIRELSLELCNIPCQAIRIRMEFESQIILKSGMEITVISIMQEEDGTHVVCAQNPPPADSSTAKNIKVSFDNVESDTRYGNPTISKPILRRPNMPTEEVKTEVQPKTEVKANIPPKMVEVATNDLKSTKPLRPLAIEKIADSGYFDCTEIINEDTFVGVAMPATCVSEISILDEIISDCKPDPTYIPNLGDTVAVLKDGVFVRGVVISNLNKQYTCALIDYGLTITVPKVEPLPDKYMDIPEFACVCKAEPAVIQEISKGSEHFMVIESPSRIKVTIKGTNKTVEIIGCRWNPFETSPLALGLKEPVNNVSIQEKSIEKEEKIYKSSLKSYQLKSSDIVIIVSEIDGSLIVRTRDCNVTLREINEELKNYQGKPILEPEVNQLVICPFTDDGLYRGTVLSVKGANAMVEYIDFGNCDTVPIKVLKSVTGKLASFPITCIKISLKGFVKSKFSVKALSYLEECAQRREKFNIVASGNDDHVYDLSFRDNNSLSEKLMALDKPSTDEINLKKAEVPPSSSKSESLPPLHKTAPVSPAVLPQSAPRATSSPTVAPIKAETAADSPVILTDIPKCKFSLGDNQLMCLFSGDIAQGTASFCIADVDKIAKQMCNLSVEIQAHVDKDQTPYHPKLFEVCLAMFEGEWYRAVYIKQVEQCYGMYYFDYGNAKTVTSEDIRKMPKELGKIECLSALCVFQGVKQNEEIKEPLLSKLIAAIQDNNIYEVNVVEEEDNCYVITIPSLYDQWKKEGLLS